MKDVLSQGRMPGGRPLRRVGAAVLVLAASLALAPAASATHPVTKRTATFKAVLQGSTHAPRINVMWPWSVHVSDLKGRPVAATITVQIRDPLGGIHPVAYGGTKTKYIVNRPFRGVFCDYVIFPPESKGFRLTLRMTVKVKTRRVLLTYAATPR